MAFRVKLKGAYGLDCPDVVLRCVVGGLIATTVVAIWIYCFWPVVLFLTEAIPILSVEAWQFATGFSIGLIGWIGFSCWTTSVHCIWTSMRVKKEVARRMIEMVDDWEHVGSVLDVCCGRGLLLNSAALAMKHFQSTDVNPIDDEKTESGGRGGGQADSGTGGQESGETLSAGAETILKQSKRLHAGTTPSRVREALGGSRKSKKVYGVDIWRPSDLTQNSQVVTVYNASVEGVAGLADIRTADARELPFPNSTFDVVFCSLSLHLVGAEFGRRTAQARKERSRALMEMVRVVKPGGMILIWDIFHFLEYVELLNDLKTIERVTMSEPIRAFMLKSHIICATKRKR
ncbi:hypothetical protein CBR_g24389 [Chara braunii]|uniref:Methyltransferase type 11 domain-containing protein n=1 Tax=Chara braunii TaxID=69332 RepID=A0A388JMS0_CHABU|nr:hypothetical protein CBR_g24389 [Chara braunii]|eukprot:GBG59043.1 hypothetical protein CBR_g24389 [Chara braunii]